MPISLVAVFALAALLSAGLLVFNSGGAQAQTATGAIADVTLDVGQALTDDDPTDDTGDNPTVDDAILTVTVDAVAATDGVTAVVGIPRAFPMGATGFTIASDQDDPGGVAHLLGSADEDGQIETNISGNNRNTSDSISINPSGVITIPDDFRHASPCGSG